jgi:GNAT superfamily N-acetyltransferase
VATVTIHPLTPSRWPDLERLFGARGACGGCWCMWWRLPRSTFKAEKGEGNRRALESYVRSGAVPGLLAYEGATPVAWVAIEPRAAYPGLARSRNLAPVDDAEVWSITCFFVARSHRGQGLMRTLVDAAVEHAGERGARIVEAYPVDYDKAVGDAFVYTGALSAFAAAGFEEVARRSPTRPIVRRAINGPRASAGRDRARGHSTRGTRPTRSSGSRRDR